MALTYPCKYMDSVFNEYEDREAKTKPQTPPAVHMRPMQT